MTEFGCRIRYEAVIPPGPSVLSLAAVGSDKKNLAGTGATAANRLLPQDHLARLDPPPRPPLAVAGVRNVLSNLRCVGYSAALCRQAGLPPGTVVTVAEEHDRPGRPYHVVRRAGGGLTIDEFQPVGSLRDPQPGLLDTDWLVSGTPVLWDCEPDELFERVVTDAADHSHVWRLPRGNSPAATDATRDRWRALQDVFTRTLPAARADAAAELTALAGRFGLEREDDYLHSVWGVGPGGELIVVIAHGRLEAVGELARARGARRAICVENSGSSALYFDPHATGFVPQVRAPNHRPAGTGFVFFELPTNQFAALPDLPAG